MDNTKNFKELLENRFGNNFTCSISEMKKFIIELVEDGFSIDDIYKSLLAFYRDEIIDYYDLKALLDALDLPLVNEFSFYSEKAKQVLREIASKVETESQLLNYLYNYYYNNKIEFKVFQVACLLMGYNLIDEFINMNDDDRRNAFWTYDKNDKPIILKDASADLFKEVMSFQYIEQNELLYPRIMYRYPFDFVFDYMDQKGIDDHYLVERGLCRKKKHKLAYAHTLKKAEMFSLIFILDMPTPIAKQFLALGGYCFSPLIALDVFMLDYLNGKYPKAKNLEELEEMAIKLGGVYQSSKKEHILVLPIWL